ncbi:hypothetical protein HUT06_01320 [Actinomadura sp. NAK00032]|uniref:hypothetical protein n=1 Tax=Actinomadura sp. NAK00032 TaxID=2742128 RepID=UPI001592A336|nr:hypothetical protein [Actinomadura sp. NAK00032]QKW32842.1 hypothetical protein HUT06_01320 [Actinomadura sp. NAK00032]
MNRDVFAARFAASARAARQLAQSLVSERLPEPLVFRVRLNQSYDGHAPQPGELRFPEDSAYGTAVALSRCDAETVVAALWRDGHVPEWINIAAISETGTETVIELICCGRFTSDDSHLYHPEEGWPPFHVLSPAQPPQYDGTPFSIHTRAECWNRSDLEQLATACGKVWSFTLMTDEFDDDLLSALPDLPGVEILEHRVCTLGAEAMSAFSRFPELRVLRLHLSAPSEPSAFHTGAGGGRLNALTDLTITGLPPCPWGQEMLDEVAPRLTNVDLGATETLWLDAAFPSSVSSVSLTAADVAGPARLPEELDRLSIHLTAATDEDVATLLDGVTRIRSLSLRGTPVSDAILPVIEPYDLDYLDLVGTEVTDTALSRIRADRPGIRMFPRLAFQNNGNPAS